MRLSFNYFDINNFDPFNHLWYLSVDFQALLLISFILILFINKKTIDCFLYIIFIASFIFFSYSHLKNENISFYFNTFSRIWEIVAGIIVYYLFKKEKNTYNIAFIISSILLLVLFKPISLTYTLTLITILATSLILITKNNSYINISSNFKKYINKLSSYTYIGYLVHYPVILICDVIFKDPISKIISILSTLIFIFLVNKLSSFLISEVSIKARYKYYMVIVLWQPISIFFLNSNYLSNKNAGVFSKINIVYPKNQFQDCILTKKILKKEKWLVDILDNCSINLQTSESSLENKDNFIFLGDSHALEYSKIFSRKTSANTYALIGYDFIEASNDNKFVKSNLEFIEKKFLDKENKFIISFYSKRLKFNNEESIIIKTGIENIIKFLETQNKQTVFLIDYPFQCEKKTFYKSLIFNDFKFCDNQIKEYSQSNNNYFEFINYLMINYKSNIVFKNPKNYLCRNSQCKMFSNGKLLFYDDSMHLTEEGIKYFKKKLPINFFKI
tara:strand:+ start:171 stop:1676 length:1506 start_codon:yes stop_codon:yes gene_type:complete